MSSHPFFSIITCTRNSERFLAETIASVAAQTYADYEHIFIDGFSTDGTMTLVENYRKSNPSKIRIIQQKAQGITAAMNAGIQESKGQYIIHLHSDDLFFDANVLKTVEVFLKQHPQVDWIYGQCRYIYADGQELKILNSSRLSQIDSRSLWHKQLLKYQNIICHQSVFIRREVFVRFGLFDVKDRHTADYDYWLRIMNNTAWSYIPVLISNFRVHDSSNSSSISHQHLMAVATTLAQKRHLNWLEFHIILPTYHLISANYYYIKNLLRMYHDARGKRYTDN